jgi:hypothetical protein
MSIAANFLKQIRLTEIGNVGKQLSTNLASATEVNIPNVPDINVGRLAPRAPTTGGRVQVGYRGADREGASAKRTIFKSAGLPEIEGISKKGIEGYGKLATKLRKALKGTSTSSTTPSEPSSSSLIYAKDGGFITKK